MARIVPVSGTFLATCEGRLSAETFSGVVSLRIDAKISSAGISGLAVSRVAEARGAIHEATSDPQIARDITTAIVTNALRVFAAHLMEPDGVAKIMRTLCSD
jgi:hypothetical protein